jgi:hypothetical protein
VDNRWKIEGRFYVLIACLTVTACSAGQDPGPGSGSGGSGSGGTTGGGAGGSDTVDAGGTGGAAPGTGGMIAPGSGGAVMDASVGDGAGGDAVGADAGGSQSFSCTLILGAGQAVQWYGGGGFEAAVGTDKWEIQGNDIAYAESWANARNLVWSLPLQSPCATNSMMPDRVLLTAYGRTTNSQADWEAQLGMVVTNIKAKYPGVRRIELLSLARGPGNTMCGTVPASSTSAAQDMAMQVVADGSAGMIKVGPQYFVPSCAAFSTTSTTSLTVAGAMAVAQMLAPAYK